MGSLCANPDDSRGIVGNILILEGEAGRPDKLGVAMVGYLLGSLCREGHEGMNPFQLVIRDDYKKGEKGLLNCQQVTVSWLPFKGGKVL